MPTYDYTGIRSTARSLLTKFGQTLILRRLSGSSYDPVTGVVSGGSTSDTNIQAVALTITSDYIARVGADSVQADDRLYIIEDTTAPLVSDTLVIAAVPWSIVRVEAINPGGTAMLYRVQVRA